MKIWQSAITLKALNDRGQNTLAELLDIKFIEIGDTFLVAEMPISSRVKQPLGIMHGGASCVLAETIASTAANACVDNSQYYCVGLDINTNHIHAIRSGKIIGTAMPYHLGKTTQVWGIEIRDEEEQLISVTRLTAAVLKRQ